MDEPDGPIRRLFIWGFAYRPRQLGCQRQRDDGGSNREGAPRCSRAALLTATIMRPAQLPPDLGFWVGNEIVHDVLRPASPSPHDEQDSSSSDDSEESKTR